MKYSCNCFIILNYLLLSIISIFQFVFLISLIKDNFEKLLVISLSHTKLFTFPNLCEMTKTTYNLGKINIVTPVLKESRIFNTYVKTDTGYINHTIRKTT